MPVNRDYFGCLQDGRSVHRIRLSDPRCDFAVEILEYGARLRSIMVPDRGGTPRNALLSYETLREYELDTAQLGGTIGRCANRIAVPDEAGLSLTRNDGTNHFHGGTVGFSRSLWRTTAWADGATPSARLEHYSGDGDEGYRGNATVSIEFSIVAPMCLRATIEATCDQSTPFNVTLHPYFNLSGKAGSSIEDHELSIAANTVLLLGRNRLPTGEIASVADSPFDFRRRKRVGACIDANHPQLRLMQGYDHYWPLDDRARIAADVLSPHSGIRLRLHTNQRGLQVYTGNHLALAAPGGFGRRTGLCLEPHGFPDALNHPGFPSIMLHPGETYRHETIYAFSNAE